jgi:DNA-binding NtrC family response regulator
MNRVLAAPASERILPDDNSAPCVERSSRRDNRMAGRPPSLWAPELPICPSDARPGQGKHPGLGSLVGQSPAMQEVFCMIRKLAPSSAPVLIAGQSGTGKELVAREIHNCSPRRNGPFIAINMAALPESLIESELFGYEKGAFTGAMERHAGCFEQACGGTLFLDELGEMPRCAQPALLRVLEDFRVRRLGGRNEVSVNVRLLAATSQSARTYLRDDIFYRLSVFQILLPPLSTRTEDIPLMAQVMIQALNQKNGTQVSGIDAEVVEAFKTYDWPGNARELRNVVERATIVAGTGTLHLKHLPTAMLKQNSAAQSVDKGSITLVPGHRLAEVEEAYIKLTLQHVSNLPEAAALLGIGARTLRKRMRTQPPTNDQVRPVKSLSAVGLAAANESDKQRLSAPPGSHVA